ITNSLALEVEIEGDVNLQELGRDAERAAESLIHTINAYRVYVKPGPGEEAVLRLRISAEAGTLYASFRYDGELANVEHWNQKMKEQLRGAPLTKVSEEHSYNEVVLKAELRELGA